MLLKTNHVIFDGGSIWLRLIYEVMSVIRYCAILLERERFNLLGGL